MVALRLRDRDDRCAEAVRQARFAVATPGHASWRRQATPRRPRRARAGPSASRATTSRSARN